MSSDPGVVEQAEPATTGPLLEIACDESGYEGEKLVGGTTDVFAHGSVRLDTATAAACVDELRRRIRSPATQYKANHVLREKHRPVLIWLLGPSGPLAGQVHVQLIDKAFFLVRQLVAALVEKNPRTAGMDVEERSGSPAVVLYRAGRSALAGDEWNAFLQAANNLLRAKEQLGLTTTVDSFFRSIDDLIAAGATGHAGGEAGEVLVRLRGAKSSADSFRAQLLGTPKRLPAVDPLIPALVRAVDRWSDDGTAISLVHDRQNTLSHERIAQVTQLVNEPDPVVPAGVHKARLARLMLVEAGLDPRIQVADFVAGVARKIASEQLNGRQDAEITALLRTYLDPASIWGDSPSWTRMMP